MRTIKFRAWTNRDKCWCGACAVRKDGMFAEKLGAEKSNGVCVATADWQELQKQEDIILMQYTGLKDKNGIEIYERDIVKPLRGGLKNVILVITYCEIELCFYAIIPNKGRGYRRLRITANKHFEVIGNIYNNPELIK